jgi:RES domain-containing protein
MAGAKGILWRIAQDTQEYRADDMTGGGAKATGGRWNSKGTPAVYASTSIALATLETLVHRGDDVPVRNDFLVCLTVPSSVWRLRDKVSAGELDITWVAEPAGGTTIRYGDEWLKRNRWPLLLVPSVIVPEEYNVLINPAHPATSNIKPLVTRQFLYDARL